MGWITAAAVIGSLTVAAAPANAAVTCSYDPPTRTVTVNMSAVSNTVQFQIGAGGAIQALPATCTGGPTVTNTDTIGVTDTSGGATSITVVEPAAFAPGFGPDGDTVPEIEFIVDFGAGFDQVELISTPASRIHVGTAGVNFNAVPGDGDADMTFSPASPDRYSIAGGPAEDLVSAQGGVGSGTPFTTGSVTLGGGGGADVLEGGDVAAPETDVLRGGLGNDTVRGFGGADVVSLDTGDDALDGGAGPDTLDYTDVQGGVTVDLASAAPQANGPIGSDSLTGFETVRGTGQGDTLSGDGGPNILSGRGGNDVVNGRGGNDNLGGGDGNDTATFLDAPAGVQVDLTAQTATGGAGADNVLDFENIVGSQAADSLTGNAVANSIAGLGGSDTISSLAGPDTLDIRDGEPDTASCGTEIDGVTADPALLDSVNADCEAVAFAPDPDPGGGGGDTEVSFDLAGKARQRVLKQKGVVIEVLCPLEDCTATASAKKAPEPVTESVAGGVAEKIKLELKRKRLRAVAAALRAGKNPRITVTTTVTDAAGNAASDSLRVTAKR